MILTDKEYDRQTTEYDKVKVKCSCDARVIIPVQIDKVICHRCRHWVFRDKKKELEYRLKEKGVKLK